MNTPFKEFASKIDSIQNVQEMMKVFMPFLELQQKQIALQQNQITTILEVLDSHEKGLTGALEILANKGL